MLAILTWAALLGAGPMDDVMQKAEEHIIFFSGGPYEKERFKYRLIKPSKIEQGKKYPVVLFLHGAGERGDDNAAQLKFLPQWMAQADYQERFPCFLIAPQCRRGETWAKINWKSVDSEPAKDPTEQAQVAMAILDEAMKTYPIDPDRQYLTGLSMGGFGSWDLAARYPDRFAAVVPICGGGDESQAEKLTKIPIWCFHGDSDPAVPVERSRKMIDAVRKAGGSPKYTELAGVGHDSWTPAYTDPEGVLKWMFEQKKSGGEVKSEPKSQP